MSKRIDAAPRPADAALLAKANRALHEQLEEALAALAASRDREADIQQRLDYERDWQQRLRPVGAGTEPEDYIVLFMR